MSKVSEGGGIYAKCTDVVGYSSNLLGYLRQRHRGGRDICQMHGGIYVKGTTGAGNCQTNENI